MMMMMMMMVFQNEKNFEYSSSIVYCQGHVNQQITHK